MNEIEQAARKRVADNEELNRYRDVIFCDWREPDHFQWVVDTPVDEVIAWVKAIAPNYEPDLRKLKLDIAVILFDPEDIGEDKIEQIAEWIEESRDEIRSNLWGAEDCAEWIKTSDPYGWFSRLAY